MRLPRWLLRHTITVERYAGDGPFGPAFDPPTPVRCFAEQKTRLVRDRHGNEVVSSATFYCPPDTPEVPAESVVTFRGATSTVIVAALRDGAGLATPDHLELAVA